MNEQSIFLKALKIQDITERESYLMDACSGNGELLQKLQSMLASNEKSSHSLDDPSPTQIGDDPGMTQAMPRHNRGDVDLSYLNASKTTNSLGTMGHYEILEILGQGGFGTVLKAFDEKLQRFVAIKVLNRNLAATSPPRKRFLREARSVAAIKNENVVAIYSVEEAPIPYFVMEYVDGEILQDKMDHSGPFSVSEILQIGKQIASGLAAAHSQGLIHRDIKPANILLEKGIVQKIKITDFGLARATDDASMTQSGTVVGTPLYMAPEQAKGGLLDERTDLFSLGSVLYALAAGHPPFRASTTLAVLRRVTDDTPRPISEVISDIPEWFDAIVKKLLEKRPEDRFQSAQELVDVLTNCQYELQAGVPVTAANRYGAAAVKHPFSIEKTDPIPSTITPGRILIRLALAFATLAVAIVFLYSTRETPLPDAPKDPAKGSLAQNTSSIPDEKSNELSKNQPLSMLNNDSSKENLSSLVTHPFDTLNSNFVNSIGMEFVKVPKGTAWLAGGGGQQGNTKIEILNDFYLGKFEVTQEQWEAVTGLNPSHFSRNGKADDVLKDISDSDLKRFPVESVTWEECQLFIEKLNTMENDSGYVYRLPREVEWEYACRGGSIQEQDSKFSFYLSMPSNDLIPEQANYSFPGSLGRPVKVGCYVPNALGFYDMHGNVWEWCEDVMSSADGITFHVYRGGSWFNDAAHCSAASYDKTDPSLRNFYLGFRLVLSRSERQFSQPTK